MKSSEKLFEFSNYINRLLDEFKQEVGELTEVELNRKIGKDTWSIGQVLDHLVQIKRTYFEQFDNAKHKFKPFEDTDEKHSWMGKWMMKYVEPKRQKRSKTVKPFLPGNEKGIYTENIKKELYESQQKLKRLIDEMSQYSLYKGKVKSPANSLIKFYPGEILEVILNHEERHLHQIREIKSHELFKI